MKNVFRLDDTQPIVKPTQRLPNGMLRVPAFLTTVGIFHYIREEDGSVRHELRPEEEVFKPESLETFEMVPVTNGHPSKIKYPKGVTAENSRELSVGHAGDHIWREGKRVAANLLIADADAIRDVDAGKRQISNGYFSDLDPTPGIAPGYACVTCGTEKYDVIQRNIVGNHIAIVDQARAGEATRLRLDSADNVIVPGACAENAPDIGEKQTRTETTAATTETTTMAAKVIRLDGVDVEVTNEPAAQFLERREAQHAAERVSAAKLHTDELKSLSEKHAGEVAALRQDSADQKKKAETQQARADAAEAQVKELQEKLSTATDQKTIEKLAGERASLTSRCQKVFGSEFKCDGLSLADIKRAAVMKMAPELKLDGKSMDYVEAYFEGRIGAFEKAAADGVLRLDAGAGNVGGGPTGGDKAPTTKSMAKDLAADVQRLSGQGADAWDKNTTAKA